MQGANLKHQTNVGELVSDISTLISQYSGEARLLNIWRELEEKDLKKVKYKTVMFIFSILEKLDFFYWNK